MSDTPQTPDRWKSPDEESIDPFALPEDANKPVEIQLPTPEPQFAAQEKNKIQKELLEEIEKKMVAIHPQLTFYENNRFDEADLALYNNTDAETILRTKSRLNAEQIEAALACTNDLNIQALAGTGKTSLLSACISYLIAIGKDPSRIVIASHTVTAAEEIKGRIAPTMEMLFPECHAALGETKLSTGTIHAIAYRELIAHKHPKARWTILDEPQQFRVWKEATMFAFPDQVQDKDEGGGEDMRLFDRVRGYDIPESRVPDVLRLISDTTELAKIADTYQKIKEARKLLDYTDLLREWAPLIAHPGYKRKWDYFFVDEFQDTNPLQKFLLKLLKLQGTYLVVCGDNRQSINSFTGSDPTSHEEFFKEFGIRETWLQTNYRCSKEIIALANSILDGMNPPEKGRLQAFSGAPAGEPAKMVFTRPESDRRKWLPPKEAEAEKRKEAATSCREGIRLLEDFLKEKEVEKPSVAILYRTNAQGSMMEETFATINADRQKAGLPPIKYSRKDYRRTALRNKTEKEAIAVLLTWCAPVNTSWSDLLLSDYFHGIGEVTARAIQRKADRQKPRTFEDTMELFDGELSRRNAGTVAEFFESWEAAWGGETPDEDKEPNGETAVAALSAWIEKSAALKNHESGSKKAIEEAQKRSYEAGIFERIRGKCATGMTLSAALTEVTEENEKAALAASNANRALGLADSGARAEKEEGIILSTIHLAKGREYDGVVIHQVSRGSLPHFYSLRFYENPKNWREKGFRKYSSFPSLQTEELDYARPESVPKIWRTGQPESKAKNPVEEWEDHNNPIEEEKRLLYVAVTRAKLKLTITTKDYEYPFLPREVWEKLKSERSFSK